MDKIRLNTVVNPAALNAALVDHSGYIGLYWISDEDHGPCEVVEMLVQDDISGADLAVLLAIVADHDPVRLSVDKATIQADGIDTATITVAATTADAAPVLLLVSGAEVEIALVDGIGSYPITSAAVGTITVSIKDPDNRTLDTLTIEGLA